MTIKIDNIKAFALDWWDLRPEDSTWGRFYERNSWVGITTTNTGPYDRRMIKKWVAEQRKLGNKIKIGFNKWEDCDKDASIQAHTNVCTGVWFEKESVKKDFINFLESLPPREIAIELNDNDLHNPDIIKLFKKLKGNKWIIHDNYAPVDHAIISSEKLNETIFKKISAYLGFKLMTFAPVEVELWSSDK